MDTLKLEQNQPKPKWQIDLQARREEAKASEGLPSLHFISKCTPSCLKLLVRYFKTNRMPVFKRGAGGVKKKKFAKCMIEIFSKFFGRNS